MGGTHKAKGKVCHLFHTVCVCGGGGLSERSPLLNDYYESLEGQSSVSAVCWNATRDRQGGKLFTCLLYVTPIQFSNRLQ